ncbi:D-alanyl-D-alanine carboxypeptidase [uncultured Caudovirales phage]|uniref:D-alanyl-D-alanine carboxypeptidase n=1 Tax=uncultured Caudovirales phage TaxID=2100421 RepID=A0A6J7WPE0_9CAUD|nr:D-alanyl-D-alanine carboxypeptidase [uncultured Caudovirales phage]CAB4124002.1 D-alanyl-D-alanine carboxypeptidase [uncultured Caudovirales phage]CAB5219627.1 D-alanyl-D-alanine carboxypeptidase [uncultured Caudovirales phage]
MINSRSLDELHPKVKVLCESFIAKCKEQNIDVLITSTYRDAESQNALYALGRTVIGSNPKPSKPFGDIVTNARAGQSFHNWRVAFDFVPLIHGKAVWNDIKLFTQCGEIAESVGLEWAGRWKSFTETAHCQFTGGLRLADFQAGKALSK